MDKLIDLWGIMHINIKKVLGVIPKILADIKEKRHRRVIDTILNMSIYPALSPDDKLISRAESTCFHA